MAARTRDAVPSAPTRKSYSTVWGGLLGEVKVACRECKHSTEGGKGHCVSGVRALQKREESERSVTLGLVPFERRGM